jgi:hypothetical protein
MTNLFWRRSLVPRTCAIHQEIKAWGRQQPPLPLLAEKSGWTRDEALRRWHGQSVLRQVEVEYTDEQSTQEEVRFIVVHSSQLAQQHTQTYAVAQEKEAKAMADHVQRIHARRFACLPNAEAALAGHEGQGPGRRGRRPRPWRYHTVRYYIAADTHHTRRSRRGWPAKADPPPMEASYRPMMETEALADPEEDNGWTVLATTVRTEACADAEILQVY